MRVIAGRWRGRAIAAPPGNATRPTADRVREALFSMLTSRIGSFEELHVLDGFAGTGALGLEALSRGAAHCTFVERDGAAVKVLKANIAALGAEASVIPTSVENLGVARAPCALILLDPPYGEGLGPIALARLVAQGWLAPHAWVSVETSRKEVLEMPGFEELAVRDHGKARLHLLRGTGG